MYISNGSTDSMQCLEGSMTMTQSVSPTDRNRLDGNGARREDGGDALYNILLYCMSCNGI